MRSLSACTVLFALLLVAGTDIPAQAALNRQEAVELLLAWVGKYNPSVTGPTATEAVYKNGGYTVTLSGLPPGLPVRWRIDAQTTEVFADLGTGKFVVPPNAQAQGTIQGNAAFKARFPGLLPPQAQVVEYQPLGPAAADRAFVLWMEAPKNVPFEKGEIYTCPDYTRGSHWAGPTRISLVDTKAVRLVNTLSVQDPLEDGDTFALPWRIPAATSYGFAYHVPEGAGKEREGRPALVRLQDLTGRGQALDFYLASSGNCMLTLYAVFGYSPQSDQVLHYQAELTVTQAKKSQTRRADWLNFWPVGKPAGPGRYRWTVDTSGRGGCLETFDIRFYPATSTFKGTLAVTHCEP